MGPIVGLRYPRHFWFLMVFKSGAKGWPLLLLLSDQLLDNREAKRKQHECVCAPVAHVFSIDFLLKTQVLLKLPKVHAQRTHGRNSWDRLGGGTGWKLMMLRGCWLSNTTGPSWTLAFAKPTSKAPRRTKPSEKSYNK